MGQECILVVDDDPGIRQMLSRFFSGKGYRILIAAVVDQAIEQLGVEKVDVIISDFNMPRKTGEDLYEFVSVNHNYLAGRFILITGDCSHDAQSRFIQKTNVRVLAKPFKLAMLKQMIEEITVG